MLLRRHVLVTQQDSRVSARMTPTEIFNSIRRTSMRLSKRSSSRRSKEPRENDSAKSDPDQLEVVTERTYSGNTLLSISPLHAPNTVPLQAVFTRPSASDLAKLHDRDPEVLLDRKIDLDEIAIDAAPFQLVLGSSLYKVHTLFSLLGLSHAYVTDCGRLVGVVGLKELRDALANIYVRGAVVPERKLTSGTTLTFKGSQQKINNSSEVTNGLVVKAEQPKYGNNLSVPECL
ncbi:hypothetical protein ANCDUO_17428 [Ancylostoma duodenale]|uniref:CBS domain-containing protein n=1 Tax=Ancylostoma duodenale TaxID=51022 RepID=A0A0C2G5X6_9BILA|nr:hypothetical protein ANCDUO_17428 [Ancylostoma duodenale]